VPPLWSRAYVCTGETRVLHSKTRVRVLLKQDTPPFGAKAFGFQSGFAGTICPLGHTIPVPLGTGMHGSYLITIVIKLSELIIK
jgi:hypothetical protein